ncbi:uncharacterized protein LOC117655455 isoform X1 [Pantherophis guttatus]|uniref:ribonuclease H n=1 Tax=Pantherophis guttatus TaxID=94885 RepID=A0A6P9AJV9_PANGU|nr:uncharacterized protein LOC117655455 isoform X1 [Pantherophis guttatus]
MTASHGIPLAVVYNFSTINGSSRPRTLGSFIRCLPACRSSSWDVRLLDIFAALCHVLPNRAACYRSLPFTQHQSNREGPTGTTWFGILFDALSRPETFRGLSGHLELETTKPFHLLSQIQDALPGVHLGGGVRRGDLLQSVDLREAYLHVPVSPSHRKFLRFQIGDDHYQYCAMPFGLSSAPRTFTKLVAVVAASLRKIPVRVLCYLDDILVLSSSRSQAARDLHLVIMAFQNHGFSINFPKSYLYPSTSLLHLGAVIDSIRGQVFSISRQDLESSRPDTSSSVSSLHPPSPAVTTAGEDGVVLLNCSMGTTSREAIAMVSAPLPALGMQRFPSQSIPSTSTSAVVSVVDGIGRAQGLALSDSTQNDSNFGRQPSRLGSPPSTSGGARSLVHSRKRPQHQSVGTQSNPPGPQTFSIAVGGSPRPCAHGQHCSQGPCKQRRRDSFEVSDVRSGESIPVGGMPPSFFESRSHLRRRQRAGRLAQQTKSRSLRMAAASEALSRSHPSIRHACRGLVRQSVECPTSTLCDSLPLPVGDGS